MGILGGRLYIQGRTNPAFSKPCLFLSDTRQSRHFRRFRWSEEPNPCFQWVECKFVIFAAFVKNGPFFGRGQKHGLPKTRFVRPGFMGVLVGVHVGTSVGVLVGLLWSPLRLSSCSDSFQPNRKCRCNCGQVHLLFDGHTKAEV